MTLLLALILAAGKPALEAAIVLHWTPVAGAVAYQVEIASDETFVEPLAQQRVSITQFRWDAVPETRVYWRVRSIDDENRFGEWSDSKEIATVFVAPVPTKPKAQTVFAPDERVRLEWTASKIFTSYRVEISSDGSFAHPLVDKLVSEAHFIFATAGVGTFAWRVRGIDFADRVTAPCPTQRFTVRAKPTPVAAATEPSSLPTSEPVAVTHPRAPATSPARVPAPLHWQDPWQIGPSLFLGHNLHALILYSLGIEVGYLRGTAREQVGFTLHAGFYLATQVARGIVTQALVFPADIDFTYARVWRHLRLRIGLGLALNASVAVVNAAGLPQSSQVALSPGVATFVGAELPLGPGAVSLEVRLSTAPRTTTQVIFETGGLVAAFGYLFYL